MFYVYESQTMAGNAVLLKDVIRVNPRFQGAVASELTALKWVQDNTPELRDDRAARRELALRIADATRIFTCCLNMLLAPGREPLGCSCAWYWQGKRQQVASFRDITRLLSDVCDTIYHQSPKIRNELIVRRAISSAAAAARRSLIEHADQ